MVAEGEGLVKSDSQELRVWIEWDSIPADLDDGSDQELLCFGGG